MERVACTVYVTNIERTVSKEILLGFFSNLCGVCEGRWKGRGCGWQASQRLSLLLWDQQRAWPGDKWPLIT